MVMKISYFGKAVRSIIFSLQNRLPGRHFPTRIGKYLRASVP